MTPNLFILGAAKSGTTTLWNMLRQHPDVHMSDPKEPSFFCSHFQVVANPIWYFGLFNSPKRWRGDASHVYMTNPETAPLLRDLFPQARFVVILRDPAARAHALYRHMRRYRHADGQPLEPLDRFEDALAAEDARFGDRVFWHGCRQYFWNFMYARSGFYDEQLARYFALFPRDQFHVLTLADLSFRPVDSCNQLGAFLAIDPAPLLSAASQVMNEDPAPHPVSAEAQALMAQRFHGLTARVDALLGRALDWRL